MCASGMPWFFLEDANGRSRTRGAGRAWATPRPPPLPPCGCLSSHRSLLLLGEGGGAGGGARGETDGPTRGEGKHGFLGVNAAAEGGERRPPSPLRRNGVQQESEAAVMVRTGLAIHGTEPATATGPSSR